MDTKYIPDDEYVAKVKELGATLTNEDGHMRWIVMGENGEQDYAIRPESARPATE